MKAYCRHRIQEHLYCHYLYLASFYDSYPPSFVITLGSGSPHIDYSTGRWDLILDLNCNYVSGLCVQNKWEF